jgi:hypothetical protein
MPNLTGTLEHLLNPGQLVSHPFCVPPAAAAVWPDSQGTVGAGLPVIGTLKHLLETGDKAQVIEGIFSGTLSYIFNTFGDGRPFSEIVTDAKAQVGQGGCCDCSRDGPVVNLHSDLPLTAVAVGVAAPGASDLHRCGTTSVTTLTPFTTPHPPAMYLPAGLH